MELSDGTSKDFKFGKLLKKDLKRPLMPSCDFETDIIDVSKVNFEDDQSWLYPAPSTQNRVTDLSSWLHNHFDISNDDATLNSSFNSDYQKNIDTRTFTRPKKRFTRPSIEKYNEEMYGTNDKNETIVRTETKPLNFDLNQPLNSHYFDNMVANLGEADSFQNMSPPSLVNSMCSSIFTNLMESSFIKNDPELREIRDTDFTEKVLLQDCEPPMFQSITESCSSLNSDTPEGFLKKVSRSDTFKVNSSTNLDRTLTTQDFKSIEENKEKSFEDSQTLSEDLNKTFSCKELDALKTPEKNNLSLNSTFVLEQSDSEDIKKLNLSNNKKKEEPVQITDLNRLGYYLVDENISYNEPNDLNKTVNVKRSSISTGSADSLDRMSSISNGSRESSKILNMADVDAIIEMQEKSLQQVMSTPQLNTAQNHLWQNNFLINGENFSDSDVSSNDEYKSVRSSFSKTSLDNFVPPKPVKSLNYLKDATQKDVKAKQSNLRSVQSNVPGSQTNLHRGNNVTVSNLKTMGSKLKGSYTSLRPISANLPVAPPPVNSVLNSTITLSRTDVRNVDGSPRRMTEVLQVPRENSAQHDATFVKPQSRPSFLPRPTGIPRPSRIPAPRASSARSSTKSGLGRSDRHNNLQ